MPILEPQAGMQSQGNSTAPETFQPNLLNLETNLEDQRADWRDYVYDPAVRYFRADEERYIYDDYIEEHGMFDDEVVRTPASMDADLKHADEGENPCRIMSNGDYGQAEWGPLDGVESFEEPFETESLQERALHEYNERQDDLVGFWRPNKLY